MNRQLLGLSSQTLQLGSAPVVAPAVAPAATERPATISSGRDTPTVSLDRDAALLNETDGNAPGSRGWPQMIKLALENATAIYEGFQAVRNSDGIHQV